MSSQPDTIAHAQFINPADVVRLGKDHINVAFTYAWSYTDPDYDITVVPFIDKVTGTGPRALHDPKFYYERNAYPTRSVKAAGATLIAGPDAPVDTRDPRPFTNMQMALTRRFAGQPALNPSQTIGINDVLDADTINGARALGRGDDIGSIRVHFRTCHRLHQREFDKKTCIRASSASNARAYPRALGLPPDTYPMPACNRPALTLRLPHPITSSRHSSGSA